MDAAPGPRTILITGGTGTLGREVVASIETRPGWRPRILSQRPAPPDLSAGRTWARADLVHDDLVAAVEGVEVVVHLASGKGSGDDDVLATRRLLAAAETAAVRHVVVISIIGADRISLPYYASKVAIETAVRAAAVPWSIVRVAQFHSFVERLVAVPASLPTPSPLFADLRFQPVDEREVADRLVEVAVGPAAGDTPEVAGPELLTLGQIAATWQAVTGSAARLVPVPLSAVAGTSSDGLLGSAPSLVPAPWVVPMLEGYRDAWNTPQGERILGRVTFERWLRRRSSGAA